MSSEVIVKKSALIHNLRAYRRAIGDTKIMSIVKSNAYGHGIAEVSKILEKETDWFGTASGSEALQLRKIGIRKPILVLNFYTDGEVEQLIKSKVSLAVYDSKQVSLISRIAKKLKTQARVHVKVDTGTSRLGIFPKDIKEFLDKIIKLENITVEGLFSHFAASEDDREFTQEQNHIFDTVIEEFEWRGIDPVKHIACTASMLAFPRSRFDLVRLGIGLYGLSSYKSKASTMQNFPKLRPMSAISWSTSVIAVKDLPKGAYVGYGLTYQTKKPTKMAVLPVGYYDGYDRKLSNQGEVLISGQRCRVMGRVCMNLIMVDASSVKNVKVGDQAVLIGKQVSEEITADELAEKIGTINYEIVARINPLIPRKIV